MTKASGTHPEAFHCLSVSQAQAVGYATPRIEATIQAAATGAGIKQ
jgi:hypothetical protein